MRCPFCQGQHWVVRGGQMMPCPECGGIGAIHCCDGMVAMAHERCLQQAEDNDEIEAEVPVGCASAF